MSQTEKRKLSSNAIHIAIRRYRTWRTPRLKSLMHTLACYGSPEGKNIWPGVGQLADDENCSSRQIQRLLQELERDGFIVALNKKGGRGHTTQYEIVLKKLNLCIEDSVTPQDTPVVTALPPRDDIPDEDPPNLSHVLRKLYSTLEFQQRAYDEALIKHSPNVSHWPDRIAKTQARIAEMEGALQNVL